MTQPPQDPWSNPQGFGSEAPPPPPPPAGPPVPQYPAPNYPPPATPTPPPMAPNPNAYASWGSRVGAYLIDSLVMIPGFLIVGIGVGILAATATTDPITGEATGGNPIGLLVAALGYLVAIAIMIWNVVIRQGKTGQTVGKKMLGIKLISEQTGQPLGALMTFVRQMAHIVDGIPCNLGYLWPLWDPKRQTWADKIMSTVVIPVPKG